MKSKKMLKDLQDILVAVFAFGLVFVMVMLGVALFSIITDAVVEKPEPVKCEIMEGK